MHKHEFNGKLDTAVDGLANAIARKGVEFPSEFNEIPGASKLGVPEPKQGASHHGQVSPYEPAMRGFIKEEAGGLLAPWKDLPDPEAFVAPMGEIIAAKAVLANHHIESVGDIASMKLGTQMSEYMTAVAANLEPWRGKTMDAVKLNYIERFNELIFLQTNVLQVLELTMKAHGGGINTAQNDVLKIIGDATAAVDAIDCFGGDSNKNAAFNIVAGILGVLSAATLPVGALAGIAVAAGGLGLTKDLVSSPDPGSKPLGASRISGVWSNFTAAVNTSKENYKQGEHCLAQGIHDFRCALFGQFKVGKDGASADVRARGVDLMRLLEPVDTGDVQPPVKTER